MAVPSYISSQQCIEVLPISPHSCLHLLFSIALIGAILMAARWHIIVVLICIPWWIVMLIIFSCAYLSFVYLLWRNVLSQVLNWVISGFFVCLFKSFLHILDINVLSGIWFANIFSYSVNSLFTLMILSLIYKSFLNFRRFSLCYLCF